MVDIHNWTTNSINDTVADVLTHLQYKYGQLMPQKILKREDTVKKTIYHPRKTITSAFSLAKGLLEYTDTTGTSYTQHQAINIAYVIINMTGKFSLAIIEWNLIPAVNCAEDVGGFQKVF